MLCSSAKSLGNCGSEADLIGFALNKLATKLHHLIFILLVSRDLVHIQVKESVDRCQPKSGDENRKFS